MHITKEGIKETNLFFAFLMAFAGYYNILIILLHLGMRGATQTLTIPIRVLIVIALGIAFLIRPKFKKQKAFIPFLFFSFFYYMRIIIELIQGSLVGMPAVDYFLYYTSFVFLPFVFVSQLKLKAKDYRIIFYSLMIGCLGLAILTYLYYGSLIGNINRISPNMGEEYISPLALSYLSALAIGLGTSYLMTNNVGRSKRLFVYATIGLSIIPFFLGSSRGSVIALFFPFIFYLFFQRNLKNKIKSIVVLVIVCVLFFIVIQFIKLGVIERIIYTIDALQSGGGSLSRLSIWYEAWMQFLNNPVIGNSLEVESTGGYPHNILLEVLITTGIFGFLGYCLFLFFTLKKAAQIIKINPSHFFIVVIFLQALMRSMFSGGIYSTSWLALGAGLIIGYDQFYKMRRKKLM